MSRTLIGRLILQLQAQGLGEGQRVIGVMNDIEQRARAVGASTNNWGVGFQRNLDRLRLSGEEMRAVQQSWINLHDSMKQRNLGSAVRGSEISTWKTETLGHFGAVRQGYANELKAMETRTRAHAKTMEGLFKPVFTSLGFYTAAYGGGLMIREGLTASSERRREQFRQDMAGVSEEDQAALFGRSEELGHRYPSIPITEIMEMSRAAYATMGDAERANATLEAMTQAIVVMQSTSGTEAAVDLMRRFMRAMDNIGVNQEGQLGIDQINELIESSTKWTQIDPDFDIGDFWGFARRAKVAGPAFSMDFLGRAPGYMQDQGADTTGNALAMAFKGFVLEAVGTAGGKRYLEERDRLGLRENGELVDVELFGSDPDAWVLKHLVPALERDGVDLDNETAVAAAVGKTTGNTMASGILTKIITQRYQIERLLENLTRTTGLESADDARHEDPFVGWKAFKTSLENLSAALTPIDHINAGLNSLAENINSLAAVGKDNPAMTAMTIGAAGYSAYRGGKGIYDGLSGGFGLRNSAIALDGSAAALTRAAAALGAGGAMPGSGRSPGSPGPAVPPKAPSANPFGIIPQVWLYMVGEGAVRDWMGQEELPSMAENIQNIRDAWTKLLPQKPQAGIEQMRAEQEANRAREEADRAAHEGWNNNFNPNILQDWLWGKANEPDFNFREHFREQFRSHELAPAAAVEPYPPHLAPPTADEHAPVRPGAEHAVPTMDDGPLLSRAREAAGELQSLMNVHGRADLDTSALDAGIAKLREMLRLMREVGRAQNSIRSNVGSEMRRGFSDAMP